MAEDGWNITVTYEDGHVETTTCPAIYLVSEALVQFVGTEHGDIARIELV